MKGIVLCLFCLTVLIDLRGGDSPYFYSIEANKGDGIIVLLNRYDLDEFECNVAKFLELNQLKPTDHLIQGKDYKLPVLVYKYNGKSIRTTLGIDDMEKAKRIANYNRLVFNRSLRQSDYETSKILWVPYHELNCKEEKAKEVDASPKEEKAAPLLSNVMTSIFGSEYCKVTRKSDKLKGKVYYISGGHGGPDPGAMAEVGGRSICEDEYAYDVSLRLARNLMEQGATVHIIVQDDNDGIRNDDILVCDHDEKTVGKHTMPINQLARLKQRTDAINDLYAEYHRKGVKNKSLFAFTLIPVQKIIARMFSSTILNIQRPGKNWRKMYRMFLKKNMPATGLMENIMGLFHAGIFIC